MPNVIIIKSTDPHLAGMAKCLVLNHSCYELLARKS